MKGLLLKDFYMSLTYCKVFFLLMLVFIGITAMNTENLFTMTYAVFLAGSIPITLLSYDEQQGWKHYNKALPYTKAEIVSSKYIFSLFAQILMIVLTFIASSIYMVLRGSVNLSLLFFTTMFACTYGLLTPAFLFPIIFRFGPQKGRLVFIALLVLLCSGITTTNSIRFRTGFTLLYEQNARLLVLPVLAGLAVFAISWVFSIMLYPKYES